MISKIVLSFANGCVFQTNDAMSMFATFIQRKSKVIYNDVCEEFFNVVRSNESCNIVSIGRLVKQKNHLLLIRAFSKIANKFPRLKLEIYGTGSLQQELESLIVKLDLSKRVLLKGYTKDIPGILSRAEVFVLSSDFEGMPNSLMEALAVGVPCISTDCPCGGPRKLIENNFNGILIPVNDENALSDGISKLLSNREFAEFLGRNAKKKAKEFHPNKVFTEWKEYVEWVVNGHK